MEVISYGVKKFEFGTFNIETGELTGAIEIPVYKGTVDNQESEAPKTEFFQEGKASPRKVVFGDATEDFRASVMDASAASAERWIGGTVTNVDGKPKWNKGTSKNGQIGGIRFTTKDDCVCTAYVAISAKRNNKMDDATIRLIDLIMTPIETGTVVPSVTWSDPAPADGEG